MRRSRGNLALVGRLVSVIAVSAVVVAADGPYRGRLLVEALEELRRGGLELIYSSAAVSPDLTITVEPSSSDPRRLLDEILAPLGLEARDGPAGTVAVVPARPEPSRSGSRDVPHRPGPQHSLLITEILVTPGVHSVILEDLASQRSIGNADAVFVPTIGGDLSRVIELLPGVAAGDNTAAFNARGSVSRDVSFVLDGLELYDPFHFQGFQSPFSLIDTKIVDRVDFLPGGFTADLGDRHGGFVEIATRAGEDSRRGEIELGSLNSRVSYRAPIAAGKGSWLMSLRGWYPDAVRDSSELGGGERLEPEFADAYLKLSLAVTRRSFFSVHGLISYDRLGFAERDPAEDVNETAEALSRTGYLWARLLNSWQRIQTETLASAGRIDRSRDGSSVPQEDAFVVADERVIDFFGFKHDLAWEITDRNAVKAGFDYRRLTASYRYSVLPLDDPASVSVVELEPKGTTIGAYVSHRGRLTRTFAAEIGFRWDRQTYTDDNQLSPRFNALWHIGERSELRLGFGRFNQSQRIHELGVEDGETAFSRAEVSEQAEMTFRHRFPDGLELRIDAYRRDLDHLRARYENLFEPVELFPETGNDRVKVEPDKANLHGVEVLLRGESGRPLTWWVSYALSSAEDEENGVDFPRAWDQTHAGKFLLGYRWGERWTVSLAGTAHTGWPTTPATGEETTLPDGSTEFERIAGERNTDRFPTYVRFDAKVSRSFSLSRGRLSLTLDVVNLADRENACCVDEFVFSSLPDGSVASWRELDYWLGITPSFSVTWEF